MPQETQIQVAVVGAGPTGLALACELARRGIPIRVLDKAIDFFQGSRAKLLSPRALEVMDDLGVAEEVLAGSLLRHPVRQYAGQHVIGEHIMNPDIAHSPDAPYPGGAMLPQWRTESVLRARLAEHGVTVELENEILDVAQDDAGVVLTVAHNGTTQRIRAAYVVGCDGAHSTIRARIGVSFDGVMNEDDRYTYLGDVHVEGLSAHCAHLWNDPERGILLMTPFRDTDLWQFTFLPVPGGPRIKPSLDSFREIWQDWAALPGVRLLDAPWTSQFRVNERIASDYRVGRVFLAGDASHIYAPTGGQGMTTGIQDSYNLAWKLAAVLAGAPDTLLDSYQAERLPVARYALSGSAERMRKVRQEAANSGNPVFFKFLQNQDTTQLGITYHGGPLAPASAGATPKLRAGDRAPDAICQRPGAEEPVRLFDLFRGPHWTVLLFCGPGHLDDIPATIHGADVRAYTVMQSEDPPGQLNNTVIDATGAAHASYGIDGGTVVLVRPDGYIASITNTARPLAWRATASTALTVQPTARR